MYKFTAEKDGKVVKTLGDFVSLNEVVQELARLEFEVHEWDDSWKAIATSSQTDFRYEFMMGAWWCENEENDDDDCR